MEGRYTQDALAVLAHTGRVHGVQRNVLVLYALLGGAHQTITEQGGELAARLDMTAAGFSRARRALVADGWLDEDEARKIGNIPYYRLADKATGHTTVVQLRA
jgi:DNA-binding transcriptional ArsR family regulator